MRYNPANRCLAALRVFGSQTGYNARNSWEFASAADALVALRDTDCLMYQNIDASFNHELHRRSSSMQRAARLQQVLETQHGIPLERSLGSMVKAAKNSGVFLDHAHK